MVNNYQPQVWSILHGRIPEIVVPGMRLGRHVRHDSRSLAYLHTLRPGIVLADVLWQRQIPILDQGDTGSCTGNAMDGALGTDPLWADLPAGHALLDEAEALRIYSAAETIDGDGPYPPNDNGSSGLSVAQAALNNGLISGYTHCTDVASTQDALMSGPVIVGINWYDSMDAPDANGLVAISPQAVVRGGHEVLVRGMSLADGLLHLDNSWGQSWGLGGSFSMSVGTYARLLSEQGDCTVPLPLDRPAPVPTPPGPVPIPTPPVPAGPDAALWEVAGPWCTGHAWRREHQIRAALEAWAAAKGYTFPATL
jgi:hypothetical protein